MPYNDQEKICCSKLELNNAKRLRHFWNSEKGRCDCGCTERFLLVGKWYCFERIREQLNDLGYSIQKNYNTGSVGGMSNAKQNK